MKYVEIADRLLKQEGVNLSTVMNHPCLRYKGKFFAMMFMMQDSLLIKVSSARVNELIETGVGRPFNITGKKFKEWVLIPLEYESDYEALMSEALDYAAGRKS